MSTLMLAVFFLLSPAVSSFADRSYAIQQKPSDLMQRHDGMAALASALERDLTADVRGIDPANTADLTRHYRNLFNAALVQHHYGDARRYLDLLRGTLENPAVRAATGLITLAYLDTLEKPGPDFHAGYRARLSDRLASLPLGDVRAILAALKNSLEAMSRRQLVEAVASGLDPAVKDGALNQNAAEALLLAAMNLEVVVPVKDDALACLDTLLGPGEAQVQVGSATRPRLGTPKAPLEGAYFGQTPPGETPAAFAPEILAALNPWVEGISFSPDGDVCFVTVGDASYSSSSLYYTTRTGKSWAPLQEPPFMAGFTLGAGPTFSADGRLVTFTGRRAQGTLDLWTVARTASGWSVPTVMPAPVNGERNENPPTFAHDGTMYFSRTGPGLQSQVLKASRNQAGTTRVETLGAPINTSPYDGDPCIAPDGHFLVFYSVRPDGVGGSDLYVSFTDGQGGWRTPVNLGRSFNSPDDEYGARLSAEGQYLFYTRHTATGNHILWVAASAIEKYAVAR